ncbi:hypothetical protein PGB90_008766 [Kerria lacca]
MSNIYIQEPPTKGKVLLVTTFGDIDIELWSREAPKACRNFVQLCLEGFYDGVIFHRVVKKFIAQTGDPTGTGYTSESIYGAPFKDEIHSRLRFVRRGLVALANNGKDDNGSQFFFTLASTPELQGKHTIFGKVVGDTLYNLIKLDEVMVDNDDRPVYETKIIKTEVLDNPFNDIIPRDANKNKKIIPVHKEKEKKQGVKNYKLLSFGEEAEEDELETITVTKKYEGKSKSTHDILDDPKLSKQTIKDEECTKYVEEDFDKKELTQQIETIKNKLNKANEKKVVTSKKSEENDEINDNYFTIQREEEKNKKLEKIRNEIKNLKREYHKEQKVKTKEIEAKKKKDKKKSEIMEDFEKNLEKYSDLKKKFSTDGKSREDFALSLMKKFEKSLINARESTSNFVDRNQIENEDKVSPIEWMGFQLEESSNQPQVLAKDANTKSDDWYELHDPRNPITKRRRENNVQQITEKRRLKYELN